MSKINIPFAILSLATSVLLWASVYNDRNDKPQQFVQTAILSAQKLPDTRYVITQIEDSVEISLSGYQKDLRAISQQTISAVVDLSKPKVGSNDYPVTIFPSSVRDFLSNTSPTVKIKIEKLATKRVDVVPMPIGNLRPGFHQDSVDTFPHWVYITGPLEAVERVVSVQVLVNLSSINQNLQELELDPRAVDVSNRTVPNIMLSETEEHPPYRYNEVENTLKIRTSVKIEPNPVVPAKK